MSQSAIVKAYNDGQRAGRVELRKEVLNWLEREYLNPSVVRKSPHAEDILELVRRLSRDVLR